MRKSKILGPDGTQLNPDPPAGFYMAGYCPLCASPVFYHGGGRGVKPATLTDPAEIIPLDPRVYKMCLCSDDVDFELHVPKSYDILTERGSIDTLFMGIHNLVTQYTHMRSAAIGMQEQLKEFSDERSGYLPEEATEGDSDSDCPSEPIVLADYRKPLPEQDPDAGGDGS